jgi:hypothetical protein
MPTPTSYTPATLRKARQLYAAGQIPEIDKIPCVCAAPRDAHTGATHAGGYAPNRCTRYREDQLLGLVARAHRARDHGFDETMAAYDAMSRGKRPKKRGVSVRPSDLGGCRRAVWYRETPPEGYQPVETDRHAAWMGTLIHEEFARRRAALYPWRMYEAGLRLPGSDSEYRLDEFDPLTGILYEIKTAGDWRWEQVGEFGPDPKWLKQVMLYARLLIALGYEVEKVVLLVLQREGGLSEPFEYAYDEKLAQQALDWIADVALTIELDLIETLPMGGRDEPGPETSKMCAKLCPAREHCWNIPRATELGHTPESLTFLLMSPDDERIAAQLDELVTLGESRRHIEKQEAALKALLKNLLIRPYGDFVPVRGGSSSTDWTGWGEEVRMWAQLPEGVRAPEMPQPKTKKGRYWRWKRERLAVRATRKATKAQMLAESAKALDTPPEPLAEAS